MLYASFIFMFPLNASTYSSMINSKASSFGSSLWSNNANGIKQQLQTKTKRKIHHHTHCSFKICLSPTSIQICLSTILHVYYYTASATRKHVHILSIPATTQSAMQGYLTSTYLLKDTISSEASFNISDIDQVHLATATAPAASSHKF